MPFLSSQLKATGRRLPRPDEKITGHNGPTPSAGAKPTGSFGAKSNQHSQLDTAKEFGDPIPAPKGSRLVFA